MRSRWWWPPRTGRATLPVRKCHLAEAEKPLSVLRDRFRGALIGGAIGDALHALHEGAGADTVGDVAPSLRSDLPLCYAGDTCMTLAVAESLFDAGGGIDCDKLIGALAAVQAAEPWRGFDEASTRAAALVRRGVGWQAAARSLDGGRGSRGHGAAARAPPVALIAHHDRRSRSRPPERGGDTRASLGQDAAVLQALAVAEALLSSGGDIDASAAVELLPQRTAHPLLRDRLERVSTLIEEGGGHVPRERPGARPGGRARRSRDLPAAPRRLR